MCKQEKGIIKQVTDTVPSSLWQTKKHQWTV